MKRGHIRRFDPIADFGGRLLQVEKPARYLGGEVGSIRKNGDDLFNIALCFPDLYEIGMSNNAIRILYSGLNAKPSVRAERVFAPAPDFERLLAESGTPLYTLESRLFLCDVDMLCVSLGYELAATSLLAVLESGRIPIRAEERGEGDPIVIAGGPAATNPHPLAAFLDAAFIGEAEAGFFDLADELGDIKRVGASRSDILDRLSKVDAVWMPARQGKGGKKARRAVFPEFTETPASTAFPLPTVKTVQDHGSVEIMRGCPNGCRFCHAGYYYRPQREKPYELIKAEVEELVSKGGYREITLSSLSSGDYSGIGSLLDRLNAEYSTRMVSFQLPSLKVNSFTLPIIGKLAEVRKSGLTFAVETPVEAWQMSINKEVSFERTVAILAEARAFGFKQAKFYFMIGLPVPGRGMGEAEAIIDFFERLQSRFSIQINVNVGVFVPKPHTPYQWAAQLSENEALEAIGYLRTELRKFRNIKLSYHSPFISQLEGLIARGDERVGELIFSAYQKGARLDAWEEHFNRELWRSVIEAAAWPAIEDFRKEREKDSPLPWDDVSLLVSPAAFAKELKKSIGGETTSPCIKECTDRCGVCGKELGISKNVEDQNANRAIERLAHARRAPVGRMIFRYCKLNSSSYLQHLSIVDAFYRAFAVAGIDIAYSEGFNPMPRLETTQPIPIAIESEAEVASVLLHEEISSNDFFSSVNLHLPSGLRVEEAFYYPIVEGKKQRTIGSLEWGSEYRIQGSSREITTAIASQLLELISSLPVPGARMDIARAEPFLKLLLKMPDRKELGLIKLLEACCEIRPVQSALQIKRTNIFAEAGDGVPVSFFEAYQKLS
jgi:radical SAM family uncharacterized protein